MFMGWVPFFTNFSPAIRPLPEAQPTRPSSYLWKPSRGSRVCGIQKSIAIFHDLPEMSRERSRAPLLSALALAEDLERWLKHEPIIARHTGIIAPGRKWMRRNPTSALLAAVTRSLAAAVAVSFGKAIYSASGMTAGIAVLPFENLSDDKETPRLSMASRTTF